MKMPIWEYNNNLYLKINAVKVKEAKVENDFKKDVPYIMDYHLVNTISQRTASRLQVIQFLKLMKFIKY